MLPLLSQSDMSSTVRSHCALSCCLSQALIEKCLLRQEKVARAKRVTDEVSLSQGKSTRAHKSKKKQAYSSMCNACLRIKSFYRRIRFSRELRARSSAVADVHRKSALRRFPFESSRTPKMQKKQAYWLAFFGAPWRIRTFDLPVRSRALYPLS